MPAEWAAAITMVTSSQKRRVVVIGPADSGKSSFVRAAMARATEAGDALRLIDLDPGQKMVGPPGTASMAHASVLERFIFLGSTSASEVSRIVNAAEALARDAHGSFIANTSGFVRGLGARLQSLTISRLRPDLIVALAEEPSLVPILAARGDLQVVRLPPSPLAQRKSPSRRAAIRQAALTQALEGAERFQLDAAVIQFTPAPPAMFETRARPLCALVSPEGEALSLGIPEQADGETIAVYSRMPARAIKLLQLGKIWAEPSDNGYKLLGHLTPSWSVDR